MHKNVSSIAFCGVITALCLVMMLLSGVIRIATIALPALAGIFLIVVVLEAGVKWALCAYAAVSVLSFLLVADKEAALIFTLFFGYYPVLKAVLDRIRSKVPQWCLKLLIFNGAAIAEYFIAIKILMVPQDEYMILGVPALAVLLLLANIVFVLYDILLLRLVILYCAKIRKKLNPFLKGK